MSIKLQIIYQRIKLFLAYFRKRPIADPNLRPLFIIGSGRSGNTLLRAILNNHPSIVIPPESYVLPKVFKLYHVYNNLPWKELVKIIYGEFEGHEEFKYWKINLNSVYRESLSLPSEKRSLAHIITLLYLAYADKKKTATVKLWGDKTPLNTLFLDQIIKIFPNAYYIHIYRDGRDVISSYLKSGIYSDPLKAAERWKDSILAVDNIKRKKPDIKLLEVKYEDLVTNPKEETKKITQFININYTDTLLNFYNNLELLDDSELSHYANLKNPINAESIGKWKKNLDNNVIEKINPVVKEELNRLGYI